MLHTEIAPVFVKSDDYSGEVSGGSPTLIGKTCKAGSGKLGGLRPGASLDGPAVIVAAVLLLEVDVGKVSWMVVVEY